MNQTARIFHIAVACILSVTIKGTAFPDTPLVYSAKSFQLGRDGNPHAVTAHSYLYAWIRGARRPVVLTHSPCDDADPSWSPDFKTLAFVRTDRSGVEALCLLRYPDLKVTCMVAFHHIDDLIYAWSSDGREIGVLTEHDAVSDPFVLVDARTGHVTRRFKDIREFCWSPDGSRLFIRTEARRCAVVDALTGLSRPEPFLGNAIWLDRTRLLGWTDTDSTFAYSILNPGTGHLLPVSLRVKANSTLDTDSNPADADEVAWHQSPADHNLYIVETDRWMSDGYHPACFLVTLGASAARARRLGPYAFCGFSPNGREFAAATYDWVGTYNEGGERLGPLQIVDLDGHRVTRVTSDLLDVEGGTWFGTFRGAETR